MKINLVIRMKNIILLEFVLLCIVLSANSQENKYRSGIFLHHSTGDCIWGPNGSNTSVVEQMNLYNIANGYTGDDSVRLNETWFPSGGNNEWSIWHTIFETDAPQVISNYLNTNKIVMIKSCFPSSEILNIGSAEDTLNPTYKSIANYKWHWRHIVNIMEAHPENFFVIWTNAPLEWYSTNSSEAALANSFCYWAKDTLAQNLDMVYGAFPKNVYVFDFFHKLADANGFLPSNYATGPGDSHPTAAATELVAPQLVNEIFDAAIAYEAEIQLNVKVYLEGPFNNLEMNTDITNSSSIINFPLSQPYNTMPWNYDGVESVSEIPPDVVDWVLVEIRDANDAVSATLDKRIDRQAAFLLFDGSIVGMNGNSLIQFNHNLSNQLFVIISHRNHLSIMSAEPLTKNGFTYNYDYSTGSDKVYGGVLGYKLIGTNVYGMATGDANGDGIINYSDKAIWDQQVGRVGYSASDFNMDIQVSTIDKNDFWVENELLISQMPE